MWRIHDQIADVGFDMHERHLHRNGVGCLTTCSKLGFDDIGGQRHFGTILGK